MPKVVGIRFHGNGKSYHFDPADMILHIGDAVIVETVQGIELGIIAEEIMDLAEDQIAAPLKGILRQATEVEIIGGKPCKRGQPCGGKGNSAPSGPGGNRAGDNRQRSRSGIPPQL